MNLYKITTIILFLFSSSALSAKMFSLKPSVSYVNIIHNEFLYPDDGSTIGTAVRTGVYLGANDSIELGLSYMQGKFDVNIEENDFSSTNIGYLQYRKYGIYIQSYFSSFTLKPYTRFALDYGQSKMKLSSLSESSINPNASLLTYVKTDTTFSTMGMEATLGLLYESFVGFFAEVSISHELWQISQINSRIINIIDDQYEAFDEEDTPFSQHLESLRGRKLGHFSQSISLGISLDL